MKSAAVAAILGSASPEVLMAETKEGLPHRALGRAGEKVSAIGLGGYHIGKQTEENESIRIMRSAIDRGITFMDNCWDYNDGISEIRMGKALRDGYRQKVFLMTKIDGRTKDAAARQIDDSLKRLQTAQIDLMQFHEVIRLEDPDRIFAPDGALEAMVDDSQEEAWRKTIEIFQEGQARPRTVALFPEDHPPRCRQTSTTTV
jgi:aryl-alcohol dehydrogenase-like predicted oxidoreductase